MNLMHANQIEGIKQVMNVLMYGYEHVTSDDGIEYYVPNYQFYDSPDHYHFMNRFTVDRLFGSNSPRMMAICTTLGKITNVQDKHKDIICFRADYLDRRYPKDEYGLIKPNYMDNHIDVTVSMIPNFIKSAFIKRHKKEPF